MYLPIKPHKTCASAWLEATKAVNACSHHEAHNVIIDIENPLEQTTADEQIIEKVDTLLRQGEGVMPVQAVANTIFPEALYRRYGMPDLYKKYLDEVFPRTKRNASDWGRYFERMIRRKTSAGKTINPLSDLIAKLKRNVHSDGHTYRNIYEMVLSDPSLDIPIFNPENDRRVMGGQCLSFLSFKLDNQNRLMLTAIYRNHYYIQRLLGNLIGLSRLMAFICEEANIDIGTLTVVSTHAQVDIPKACHRKDIDALIKRCEKAYQASEAA